MPRCLKFLDLDLSTRQSRSRFGLKIEHLALDLRGKVVLIWKTDISVSDLNVSFTSQNQK